MATEELKDWRGNTIDKKRHGGIRSAIFIYYMTTVLAAAYVANSFNLVTYLTGSMHMGVAESSTLVTNFIGAACGFALLGAFLSDSYISRFKTILIFVPFNLLGYGLLALQAHLPSLHPPYCDTSGKSNDCEQIHGFNSIFLYVGIYSIALGEGCQRACLASFGGDQFDSEDPVESRLHSSFFNWYTFGISLGGFVGLVLIVWIETDKGWDYGFGVSAFVILTGLVVLAIGFPFYRNQKPKGSPFTRMLQVFIAAFNKRRLTVPETTELEQGKEENFDKEKILHTKGLKFLDKATIDNGNSGAWSLCGTTQVEETKIVIRMIPILLASVVNYIPNLLMITLTVQQGNTMDTRIGKMHISPASLFVIPIIFQIVFLVLYDQLFVPLARKITGHPNGITPLQRVGVGFVSIIIASGIAALVERKRMEVVVENGLQDFATGVPMSVFWLGGQFFILGVTDVTAFVGLLEFFNTEVSRGMKSLGTAIFWCTLGMASWMGSLVIEAVNRGTRHGRDGKGWLDGTTLNNSHLERFYWLLFALGIGGFLIYLCCAKMYVYRPRVIQS